MTVHPEEYTGQLVDYCMLKINAVIKVKETKQSWSGEDDFVMDKPKLNIEVTLETQLNKILCQIFISLIFILFFGDYDGERDDF